MVGTRASTRNSNSNPAKGEDAVAGTKRKQETEPCPKRERKTAKKQKTIEDTIVNMKEADTEMNDAAPSVQGQDAKVDAFEENSDEQQAEPEKDDAKVDTEVNNKTTDNADENAKVEQTNNASAEANNSSTTVEQNDHEAKASKTNDDDTKKIEADGTVQDETDDISKSGTTGDGAIEESSQRENQIPSNILEKGVIYFFTRNRVSVDDASSVGDLQRTFFVLRPLPTGAKLGDGVLQDLKNNRVLALPKKVFPKSSKDRFMAFVEKANTTIQDLKDNFFKGDTYETKTQGTRQNDPVTPVAEGVYAITRTENATTHLVYSTTIPSELGEVQEDLGIKSQGSFIISVKNPERGGPASAKLAQKPNFSKE